MNIFRRSLVGNTAPDISGAAWLNASSLPQTARARIRLQKSLRFPQDLAGNIVVIEFWDHALLQCVRTLPYMRDWWKKYRKLSFLLIGVYTPQFEFGTDISNVHSAILRFGLDFPIVHDPAYETWKRYKTKSVPRTLLIDAGGVVRHDQAGEGQYHVMEQELQKLMRIMHPDVTLEKPKSSLGNSPKAIEIQLGFRGERSVNRGGLIPGQTARYSIKKALQENTWGITGQWRVQEEEIVHPAIDMRGEDSLHVRYQAKRVLGVMGAKDRQARVEVRVDGEPLPRAMFGEDVVSDHGRAYIAIGTHRLYSITEHKKPEEHTLELIPRQPGISFHSFTLESEAYL